MWPLILCAPLTVCMAGEGDVLSREEQVGLDASGSAVDTDSVQVETSGYAGVRAIQNRGGNGTEAARKSVVASIRSRLRMQENVLMLQLRPDVIQSSAPGISDVRAHVDELYWENQLSPALFAFLGRRRIVNGVAIGRNPSDFLNTAKQEDRTLTDEDRRAEKQGDDLIGWSYFGHAWSVQGMLLSAAAESKRVRALVQVAGKSDALSTDFSLIGYYADIPGIGLNISSVLGEQTTAYVEAAARKGRDRPSPIVNGNAAVIGVTQDTGTWFTDLVAGGQYTSASGLTFTGEYWRNTNGYSQSEYAGIENAVFSGRGKVPLAASLLAVPTLRRNALFFRISNIPLSDRVTLEGTSIYSLDDHSKFLRSAINWDRSDHDAIRSGIDRFYGPRLAEYGVNQTRWRLFFAYKRYF